MRALLHTLYALSLLAFGGAAVAAEPKNGLEYLTLATQQATDSGQKVEVTEFFAYYCGHCNSFEPVLAEWVKQNSKNIVFKRSHVTAQASSLPQQRLFYTLEAMGKIEQHHQQVFDAMHKQRLRLNSDELVFDWAAQVGMDRGAFIDAYRSPAVQARLRNAGHMMAAYRIHQWPMVAVNGRFVTSPYHAGLGLPKGATEKQQQQHVLKVLDYLVAQQRASSN